MKKNYLLIVFLLVHALFIKLQAQTDTDAQMEAFYSPWKTTAAKQADPLKAKPGTYQFFILGDDSTQLLRTDLAEKIESYRDEEYIVHLKVSSTTTIRILPCSEINSTHFTPLTQPVIFQPDTRDPVAKN
jgi:hypothetical protein